MKHIFILLAALLLSVGAQAVEKIDGSDLVWEISGTTLVISGDGAMPDCSSGSNTPWAVKNKEITEVVIKQGVTSVGKYSIAGFSKLTEVTLPASLTSIGGYAFFSCTSLTTINFPTGLTSIGDYAFYGCTSLTTINFPTGLTSIGGRAFQSCSNLATINFPAGLTSIGNYAFQFCSKLASIAFPAGLTSIGDNAFQFCSKLATITFSAGSNPISIGDYAFQNCSNLATIISPRMIPPEMTFSYDVFNGIKPGCELVVPTNSEEEYKKSHFVGGWDWTNSIATKTLQPITWKQTETELACGATIKAATGVNSGNPIVSRSSNPGVITDNLEVVGEGSATVTISQAGNGVYFAAEDVIKTFMVNKGDQNITWAQSPTFAAIYGGSAITLNAEAPGGAVVYSSETTTVADITGGNTLNIGVVGTSVITATQAGNSCYNAANVTSMFTVNKANPTVAPWPTVGTVVYGDSLKTATLTNGNSPQGGSFAWASPNEMPVNSGTQYSIVFTPTDNSNYDTLCHTAAVSVSKRTLTISGVYANDKIYDGTTVATVDSVAFDGLVFGETLALGTDYNVAEANFDDANVGSNKTINVSVNLVSGDGFTSNNYSLSSNLYNGSTGASITKANQTIDWEQTLSFTEGAAPVKLTAAATSGLPVSYTSGNEAVATIVNDSIRIVALGITTITANQEGNSNYNPALAVGISVEVTPKLSQTIDWNPANTVTYGDTLTAPATTNEGLMISYASNNQKVATVSGRKIAFVGTGTVIITATSEGNDSYNPATATNEFAVNAAQLTCTATGTGKVYDGSTEATVASVMLSGLKNGETLILGIDYTVTGAFQTPDADNNKPVTVTFENKNTDVAKNYNFPDSIISAFFASVNKRTLTISGVYANNKIYDGTTKAIVDSVVFDDLILGQTLKVGTDYIVTAANFDDANVGNNKTIIVKVSLFGDDYLTANNYRLSSNTHNVVSGASITQANQTINWNPENTVTYGDTLMAQDTTNVGLPLSYISSNSKATVSGRKITFVDTGIVTITATSEGSTNYAATSETVTFTVNQKQLSISASTVIPKQYDGTNVASITLGDVSGIVLGDNNTDVSVTYTATYADINQGINNVTIVYGLTGTKADKYICPEDFNTSGDITQRELTISGVYASNKIYDGTTEATVDSVAFDGLVLGQTLEAGTDYDVVEANFDDANVGNNKTINVSVSLFGVKGFTFYNYTLSDINYSGSTGAAITKANQTINWNQTLSFAEGDAPVKLTATATSGLSIRYASNNTAVAIIVDDSMLQVVGAGSITITANQEGNNNYNAALEVGTSVEVKHKNPQTIDWNPANTVVYGDTLTAPATTNEGFVISYASSNQGVAIVSGRKITFVDTGTVTITATAEENVDYALTEKTVAFTVNQKQLSIGASTVIPKQYDGTNVAFVTLGAVSGIVLGDNSAAISVTYTATYANADKGAGKLVNFVYGVTGTKSDKYKSPVDFATSGDITLKNISISGVYASDKPYDGTTVATVDSVAFDGLVLGQTLTVGADYNVAEANFDDANVGDNKTIAAKVTLVSGDDLIANNYKLSANTYNGASIAVITKADQTILWNQTLSNEGAAQVKLTATATSGLPIHYTSGNTAVADILGDSMFQVVGIGTAAITATQEGNDNYNPANSTEKIFVVEKIKLPQSIDWTPAKTTVTYGDTLTAPEKTDVELLISYTSSNSKAIVSGRKITFVDTGKVTITAASEGDNDYAVTKKSVTFTVTQKQLTIESGSTTVIPKQYDGTNVAFIKLGKVSGIVPGDDSAAISVTYTATYTDINQGNGKSMKIVHGITGTKSGRYESPKSLNTSGPISRREISISGVYASDKIYDGTTKAILDSVAFDNLVLGETLKLGTDYKVAEANFDNANVGDNKTVTVKVTLVSGNNLTSNNYTFLNNNNTYSGPTEAVITKVDQTIDWEQTLAAKLGDTLLLKATATSGLPVSYTSGNTAVAIIVNDSMLQVVDTGVVTITATQEGNNNYNPALAVETFVTVSDSVKVDPIDTVKVDQPNDSSKVDSVKVDQTIDWEQTLTYTEGQVSVIELTATASSGLPVTYTSSNTEMAEVFGNKLMVMGTGDATITATQEGNDTINPASAVQQQLTAIDSAKVDQPDDSSKVDSVKVKVDQTIDWEQTLTYTEGQVSVIELNAIATSGLPVTYTSSNTEMAEVFGNKLMVMGTGDAIITATQEGNDTINPASAVQQQLTAANVGDTTYTFNTYVTTVGCKVFMLNLRDLRTQLNTAKAEGVDTIILLSARWFRDSVELFEGVSPVGRAIAGSTCVGGYNEDDYLKDGTYYFELLVNEIQNGEAYKKTITSGTKTLSGCSDAPPVKTKLLVYPNPAAGSRSIFVRAALDASSGADNTVRVYSVSSGALVKEVKRTSEITEISLSVNPGAYSVQAGGERVKIMIAE